jgi:hypothetical protein
MACENLAALLPLEKTPKFPALTLRMCLAPAPGLPAELSSATMRAEAGELAARVARRVGKKEEASESATQPRQIAQSPDSGRNARICNKKQIGVQQPDAAKLIWRRAGAEKSRNHQNTIEFTITPNLSLI